MSIKGFLFCDNNLSYVLRVIFAFFKSDKFTGTMFDVKVMVINPERDMELMNTPGKGGLLALAFFVPFFVLTAFAAN